MTCCKLPQLLFAGEIVGVTVVVPTSFILSVKLRGWGGSKGIAAGGGGKRVERITEAGSVGLGLGHRLSNREGSDGQQHNKLN